jgi:uncharacterized membrane protein YphA (DoxX/SURF4 family)
MKNLEQKQKKHYLETPNLLQKIWFGPQRFLARNRFRMFFIMFFLFLFSVHPFLTSAHEVYVLNSSQIQQAIHTPSFSLWNEAVDNLGEFTFWAFIGILVVVGIFFISTLRFLERILDPFFLHIRRYATLIARITIGGALIAGAYYHALYGPELSLVANFGVLADMVTVMLTIIGFMIIVGYYARLAAFIGLLLYVYATAQHGWYMLTYVNYLGEIIVILLLGAHSFSVDAYRKTGKFITRMIHAEGAWFKRIRDYLVPRSFAILRVLFGTALIYASAYAKILHNDLALAVVQNYHLDKLLGFEPHFLVLGGAIVEILIGLFFILGIEIRFTALFFLFWLFLSLWFFGEAVWPHLILIGIPIAYIFYGYDDYSLEGYFFRKKKYEPVL